MILVASVIMEDIRLIKDKTELEGTCYFELLPGPYQDRCWNEQSVFMAEEVFGLLEPIFRRHVQQYDHFAFTEVAAERWTGIIHDLQRLRDKLAGAKSVDDVHGGLGFIWSTSETRFCNEFSSNSKSVVCVIDDLTTWLETVLGSQQVISILGI